MRRLNRLLGSIVRKTHKVFSIFVISGKKVENGEFGASDISGALVFIKNENATLKS